MINEVRFPILLDATLSRFERAVDGALELDATLHDGRMTLPWTIRRKLRRARTTGGVCGGADGSAGGSDSTPSLFVVFSCVESSVTVPDGGCVSGGGATETSGCVSRGGATETGGGTPRPTMRTGAESSLERAGAPISAVSSTSPSSLYCDCVGGAVDETAFFSLGLVHTTLTRAPCGLW